MADPESGPMPQHVAIIGAGWAGLAAAVALSNRGMRVTLFEASRNLGGRARRVTMDGKDLDNGQHILIGAYRDTLDLMRTVGVDPDKALTRLPLELRYADGFHLCAPELPAPLHLALALATTKGLTWAERWQAVRFMGALRAAHFRLEPDLTVSALLQRKRQGAALCKYLWEPLCISALNTPPERASASVFAAVLRDSLAGSRTDSDLLIPRTDLGTLLPEPAARFIEQHGGTIRLGTAVRNIRESDGRFRLDEDASEYTQVIVATGPQHAAALLADERLEVQRAQVEAMAWQPIVTCYLHYPETVHLPCPMLGFAGGIVQWLFDRGQLGGPKGLLAAVISAEGMHREFDQDELVQRVHREIAATQFSAMPAPAPEWSRVIAEKRATYSCDAGMQRPAMETPVPGLLLAGDYIDCDYPGTLETAVRQGLAAAQHIVRPTYKGTKEKGRP